MSGFGLVQGAEKIPGWKKWAETRLILERELERSYRELRSEILRVCGEDVGPEEMRDAVEGIVRNIKFQEDRLKTR